MLGIDNPYLLHELAAERENRPHSGGLGGPGPPSAKYNVLQFKKESTRGRCLFQSKYSLGPVCGFDEDDILVPKKRTRKIPKTPFKVLDAPALQDDYYLNLVDWSQQNVLAVGLSTCIYLWSASNSKVTKLSDLGPQDHVTAVGWSKRGTHLSIGTNSGTVQIWDVNKAKMVRELTGHTYRVGSLAWSSNVLCSGSRDKNILMRDLRQSNQAFDKLTGHKQEVCGLRWSFDE